MLQRNYNITQLIVVLLVLTKHTFSEILNYDATWKKTVYHTKNYDFLRTIQEKK